MFEWDDSRVRNVWGSDLETTEPRVLQGAPLDTEDGSQWHAAVRLPAPWLESFLSKGHCGGFHVRGVSNTYIHKNTHIEFECAGWQARVCVRSSRRLRFASYLGRMS